MNWKCFSHRRPLAFLKGNLAILTPLTKSIWPSLQMYCGAKNAVSVWRVPFFTGFGVHVPFNTSSLSELMVLFIQSTYLARYLDGLVPAKGFDCFLILILRGELDVLIHDVRKGQGYINVIYYQSLKCHSVHPFLFSRLRC